MCTLDACCYCIFLDIGCMIIAALILVSTNLNYKFKTSEVLLVYLLVLILPIETTSKYNVLLEVTSFV